MANFYRVTYIEFDFSSDDPDWGDVDPDYQKEITEETINRFWLAEDEDDLLDKISNTTGWCIQNIDYHLDTT